MPTSYKTPGVYLVEKDAFPGSVVEVATAIPAFIGYTEKTEYNGKDLTNKPFRITSFAEYLNIFGGAPSVRFTYKKPDGAAEGADSKAELLAATMFRLYDSMRIFFQNGGAACYICTVGGYTTTGENGSVTENTISKDALMNAITPFEKEQEPTMMLVPDAVSLSTVADCASVQTALLAHCDKMQNRFAILDVYDGFKERNSLDDCVNDFRENVGTDFLKYGAAYYPWVNTNIVSSNEVTFANIKPETGDTPYKTLATDLKLSVLPDPDPNDKNLANYKLDMGKVDDVVKGLKDDLKNAADDDAKAAAQEQLNYLQKNGDVIKTFQNLRDFDATKDDPTNLHNTLTAICPLYVSMMDQMLEKLNLMAPSAAMAGVYTRVDNNEGVWKAPANVSINGVVSPAVNLTNEEQEDLNVPLNGKAVNAIRYFVGDGIKVWGARTLDGNSLDWRYVNVRPTMIMLEESIKQASKAYVFDANTSTTWLTMKNMIGNFLNGIWRRGGLAGTTPEDAYEVHVGLGDTMTSEDILEGILRVTVLVALIRPAEFIELTFQQQQQKS